MLDVATSYPILDVFFTTLWIVGFFIWIWLAIIVFTDIFRSHDMSGWAKAAWVIGVFLLPLLGVLLYLLVRGKKMAQHTAEEVAANEAATEDYIRRVARGNGSSAELARLAQLRDSGVLTPQEFEQAKARLLTHTGA